MTNMILWKMSLVRKMMRGPKNGMGSTLYVCIVI